ncbi:MAG: phosphoglycerate dehydrogenase [Coxiellaceae bacterium]|nr:phosphoglycerate dehydrogenase [Coxiellaceae bacterium]
MFKIQTLNNISPTGLSQFDAGRYNISDSSDLPDAIILRSFNMHEMSLPESLYVVGRAGAGTNNIPIDKLTEAGVPVLNTPGANANAVKELVITGMLLACRNICPAWDYARQIEGDDKQLKEQVEKNKKRFSGFELPGKTLGVIGLGNIGVKVANAARYLGMNVIGFDPAITVKNAWELRSSVQQAEKLEQVLAQSDFISLHIPLIDATKNLLNAERLGIMKKGAVLINLARDGIVDNEALFKALTEEHLHTYVCDFPNNRFQNHPSVIALPHLGASTKEAEENCALMIAKQVKDYLENGNIFNSVNFPSTKMSRNDGYRLAVVNRNVPNMVAQISTTLSNADYNIIDMINKSRNEIAYTLIDVNKEIQDDLLMKLMRIEGIVKARKIPNAR